MMCNVLVLQVKPVKQDLCDLCKMVVNFVKPFVDSSATEVRDYYVYRTHEETHEVIIIILVYVYRTHEETHVK